MVFLPHPNHVYLFWIINAFLCLSIWEALDVYIFKMLIDMRIRPLTQGMLQYLWEYWLEAWGNLVNSRGLFTNWEIPTLSQLAFQVSILLLFDHLCDKVFTRIFPLYIEDATTPSTKLSTDFVVARTAVNLTIPAIHYFPTRAIPFRSGEFGNASHSATALQSLSGRLLCIC